ncbi:hypothetical protein PV02_09575 [Methanolobus chelungpuianus]|uniref:DUF2117 domain-containing protein n=2 Tax=Methanolobus chelungpuianus TaxID=502115 RepID=A0AAE3KY86_9EURY|nr:hypothetical protein [Methanolobus chelungpuianus]
MDIGIVVHGPDIVDSGMALRIIKLLEGFGTFSAVMAGTIGKTAVLDAHLEELIDIRMSLRPSACIEEFFLTKDAVVLLNHGKTIDNGRIFANMVVSNLRDRDLKPLVHVERPSSGDGEVIPWNVLSVSFAAELSRILGIGLSRVPEIVTPVSIEDQGHRIIRRVFGVHPGENILINGIVVAYALSADVSIVTEDGFVTEINGATIKEHGLEKLHNYEERTPVDITKCWIKSGPLRGNNFSARLYSKKGSSERLTGKGAGNGGMAPSASVRAAIIDHEAERSFELAAGAQVAVTIGDDTTEIAGDILYRLGIPIIGITDGDADGFTHRKHMFPGSLVFRLQPGHDDIVGRKIRTDIFGGNNSEYFSSITELHNKIALLAKDCVKFTRNY